MFPPCFSFTCWSILIFILYFQYSSATETNRTIDDYYGDSVTGRLPIYSGSWNYGPTCSGCSAHPDANLTFDASWHDATTNATASPAANTITLTFNGTAIWVYGIMLNSMPPSVVALTNISFVMDGVATGTFVHVPDPDKESPDYNVTVYSETGLQQGEHTLVVTMMQDPSPSVLLFDWAMYTYAGDSADTNATTTATTTAWSHWHHHGTDSWDRGAAYGATSGVNKGAVAGSVVGGVAALALICGVSTYWYRRRKKRASDVEMQDSNTNDREGGTPVDKPVIDPTPVQSAAIVPSPGFPSAYAGPFSPMNEKVWPASPIGVYNGEVIDIRADRMGEEQPNPARGELREQVDDLKRQVENLRSALTSDVSRPPVTLMPPPSKRRRRREKAEYEKIREQLEEVKERRRGSEGDTMGGDPPPAYVH